MLKYKASFFLLLGLTVVILLTNSCKKDKDDNVQYFLTYHSWQLASVQVFHFVGDTQGVTDTLNTTCDSTQTFNFNGNGTCTYTNYHCITQKSAGTWNIASDNITFTASLSVKDTLKGAIVAAKAFPLAKIINLGQYSLILQTGDVQTFYKATTVRTIVQYGFIHSNTP